MRRRPAVRLPDLFLRRRRSHLADGQVLERHVAINSGAGERALTPEAVVAKFIASATLTLPPARAERVCETVLDLDRIPARDLAAAVRGA